MSNPSQIKFCPNCGSSLDTFLSVESASKLLDCSQEFVRSRILNRTISFVKVGRMVRIPISEIQKLIEEFPSFDEQQKKQLRRFS